MSTSEKTYTNIRVVNKHDVEANWIKAVNFTPKQGELIIYDKDENYDYQRIKIGDGITNVNLLPFVDDAALAQANSYTDEQIDTHIHQWNDIEDRATVDDVVMMLMEMDVVQPMANADGAVFTDNNGKVYIL